MGIKRFVLFATMLGLASMVPGSLDFGPQAAGKMRPIVREATRTDTTAPLRQMPEIPALPELLGDILVKPLKRLPNRPGGGTAAPDPVLQDFLSGVGNPPTDSDVEGVDNVNGVLPPDTVGAIGPNHYVQMVNLAFAIFDRDGNVLFGPVDNKTLWQGFGGLCQRRNDGDPVVLYDHLADRWIMSQFALPRNGPFTQCIAVSATGDPTGAWHRYAFIISQDKINDYPKFGVWPDGYYMAANQFRCSVFSCSWGGQVVAAFERDEMLVGGPARMVLFDLETSAPELAGMLPADLDGPAPLVGTPNPFAQIDDGVWFSGNPPDQLQIWNFAVDWASPGDSTFGVPDANPAMASALVATEPFDSNMCDYARNCIPHPNGTALDAISDRLMYRLQYRDFGDAEPPYQTLVVNHTVDAGDTEDHAGVRWYELRNNGGGWNIHQQGTFAPDSDHRWMGSAAMNVHGDIALGYSVAGAISPSIRFTGRLGTDDLDSAKDDQMTQGEGQIIAGTGAQTHPAGRWGDYSLMAVDPTDDCTFWYTQEYYEVVGVAPWQTRVGSFQLTPCAPVNNNNASPVLEVNAGLTVGEGASGTITASDLLVTDTDNSAVEIAYTVTAPPMSGTVRLDGSETSSFTQDDIDSSRVSYLHDGSETSADGFDFAVSDGAGGSIASTPFSITVTALNDDPVLATNDGLTVANNAAGTITTSLLEVTDADNTATQIAYTVTAPPANGTVRLDGSETSSFTQDDIDNNLVSYLHDGGATTSDSLQFTVSDGAGGSIGATTFDIMVTPVGGGTTMHVGDLDASDPTSQGSTWSTTVTITVHDSGEGVVEGALVNVGWSGSGPAETDCTTDGSGQCTVSHSGIHGKKTTLTVGNVSLAEDTYDATANHDPDGDSDGTSMTVNKP